MKVERLEPINATLGPSNHPYLNGPWTPQHEEVTATDLEVIEGVIPTDIDGIYLRNTENQVHDPLGRFLCGVCRQMGFRVPEEVAVIGANNDELVCGLSYPMLSSVSIPWDTIGEMVGEALLSLLANEPPPSMPIRVPSSGVVLRHSANHLAVEDPVLRSDR